MRGCEMKKIYLAALMGLFMFSCRADPPENPPLFLTKEIALPHVSERIDHLAVDLEGQRLFIAAFGTDALEILDLRDGSIIHSITGLNQPQGVLFIPEFNKIYVTNGGTGECNIFDANSFNPLGSIKFSSDADNIRYDETAKLVYVGCAAALAVINPAADSLVREIELDGHPESFQIQSRGRRIFVNIASDSQIAVIDKKTHQAITRWWLESGGGNFPMALDENNHRLLIGCRTPPSLAVLDTETGKQVSKLDTDADADDLFYDPLRRQIYMSCGEGFIDVFAQIDPDHYAEVERIPTTPRARTSLFVPELSRFYLAVPVRGKDIAKIQVYEIPQ